MKLSQQSVANLAAADACGIEPTDHDNYFLAWVSLRGNRGYLHDATGTIARFADQSAALAAMIARPDLQAKLAPIK